MASGRRRTVAPRPQRVIIDIIVLLLSTTFVALHYSSTIILSRPASPSWERRFKGNGATASGSTTCTATIHPRRAGDDRDLLARRPEPGRRPPGKTTSSPGYEEASSKGGPAAIERRPRQYEPGRHSPSHQSFYAPPRRPPQERRGRCRRRKGAGVPADYCRIPRHIPRTTRGPTTRPPGDPPGAPTSPSTSRGGWAEVHLKPQPGSGHPPRRPTFSNFYDR